MVSAAYWVRNALPPNAPPTNGEITSTEVIGSPNAIAAAFLSERTDCDGIQMVSRSPARHSAVVA